MDPNASSSSVSGGRLPDCLYQEKPIKEQLKTRGNKIKH
jgi:hypothetical protein